MTDFENKLIMDHLDLVDVIIRTRFSFRSTNVLMSYEDLQAVGREALCRAAVCFRPELGRFATFADRCIYHAIVDHCKHENLRYRVAAIDSDEETKDEIIEEATSCQMDDDDRLGSIVVEQVLAEIKEKYSGVARRGVEAIELKLLGFSTADIAKKYGTNIKNVNAWIARAKSKLQKEEQILVIKCGRKTGAKCHISFGWAVWNPSRSPNSSSGAICSGKWKPMMRSESSTRISLRVLACGFLISTRR